MSMGFKIEICANSVESALSAQLAGADRVELCAGIPEGGTTPSFGTLIHARELLTTTELNVIIRPRGGDFLYSSLELDIMFDDIRAAREAGADGVVFGCLDENGNVNMEVMEILVEAAGDMNITFHRAFDMCRNPRRALEDLIELGIHRVLTSGAQPTAEQGIPLLKSLVEQADGRIIIMPGCGINAGNIRRIADETGAEEFHFSGRSIVESGMVFRNPSVSMGGTVRIDEYKTEVTDSGLVKAAIEALANQDLISVRSGL